ncbi:MAG: ParB/RepB/Spo0J family partition protein [Pseudomonadota bacterium]
MGRRKSLFAEANKEATLPALKVNENGRAEGAVAKKTPLEERSEGLADVSPTRRVPATTQLVLPEKCRMWRRHNRRYDLLTTEDCSDLIERIGAKGQIIPAIVRWIPQQDGDVEFEVIAGARRHFAVSHLRNEMGREDIFYKIEVKKLTDEEAFELSDLENRDRQDVSEIERAADYASALDEFYSGNQSMMADKIKLNRSTLVNYLMLARVPDNVLAAYGDPRRISIRHGKVLMAALNNPKENKALMAAAESLAAEQEKAFSLGAAYPYDGPTVFKRLKAAAASEAKKPSTRSSKLTFRLAGRGQGTVKIGRQKLTIEIPTTKGEDVEALINTLSTALQRK